MVKCTIIYFIQVNQQFNKFRKSFQFPPINHDRNVLSTQKYYNVEENLNLGNVLQHYYRAKISWNLHTYNIYIHSEVYQTKGEKEKWAERMKNLKMMIQIMELLQIMCV